MAFTAGQVYFRYLCTLQWHAVAAKGKSKWRSSEWLCGCWSILAKSMSISAEQRFHNHQTNHQTNFSTYANKVTAAGSNGKFIAERMREEGCYEGMEKVLVEHDMAAVRIKVLSKWEGEFILFWHFHEMTCCLGWTCCLRRCLKQTLKHIQCCWTGILHPLNWLFTKSFCQTEGVKSFETGFASLQRLMLYSDCRVYGLWFFFFLRVISSVPFVLTTGRKSWTAFQNRFSGLKTILVGSLCFWNDPESRGWGLQY